MDFFLYNFSDKDKIVDIDRHSRREFEYRLKPKRVIGFSLYSIILLLVVIVFCILSSFNLGLVIVFSLTLLPMSVFGLIVVVNHIAHSQNKEFIFEKNSNKFILYLGSHSKVYDMNNIEKITEYDAGYSNRLPWGDFKYWKIEMNNKEVILLSNLIMKDMDVWLKFDLNKIQRKDKFYPIMR